MVLFNIKGKNLKAFSNGKKPDRFRNAYLSSYLIDLDKNTILMIEFLTKKIVVDKICN
jgi:hypothetical protein